MTVLRYREENHFDGDPPGAALACLIDVIVGSPHLTG